METTETILENTEPLETDTQPPEIPEHPEQLPETPAYPEQPPETPVTPDETETDGSVSEMPEPELPGQDVSDSPFPDNPVSPEPEKPPDKTPDITVVPDTPVQPEDGPEEETDTGTDTEIPVPDFSDYFGELTESIERTQRMDEVLERLDTLVLMLEPEEEPEMEENSVERSSVILPDYEELPYPARVTYGITTATGYSTYVSFTYDSPEAFKSGFEKMETDVIDGNLQSFYIRYVYSGEGIDSELLYDSNSPVETPEPEPTPGTGPDNETIQQILTLLESAGTVLSDISAADKQEYLLTADYREEMLMLQSADTGASVILCIVMIAFLAEITFLEFFRRFK